MHARSAHRTARRAACPVGVLRRGSGANGIPGRHKPAHHGVRRARPDLSGLSACGPGGGGAAGGHAARSDWQRRASRKLLWLGPIGRFGEVRRRLSRRRRAAWNGHGCCGRPPARTSTTSALSPRWSARSAPPSAIDKARVYAAGMSNGGIMSYTLACNSGIFAAIGPNSATQLDACAAPHPTSVIHIHGTADRLVPYNGGHGRALSRGQRLLTSTRSGATPTIAAHPLSPPTPQSRRQPPRAPAIAASC